VAKGWCWLREVDPSELVCGREADPSDLCWLREVVPSELVFGFMVELDLKRSTDVGKGKLLPQILVVDSDCTDFSRLHLQGGQPIFSSSSISRGFFLGTGFRVQQFLRSRLSCGKLLPQCLVLRSCSQGWEVAPTVLL